MYETSYHHDLTSDYERLAGFYEAIISNAKGIVYDIGAGSGILSTWAAPYANFVYAVEINPNVAKRTKSQLKDFKNIKVILGDAKNTLFLQKANLEKADLIICEMLDTALIDEEQVPVLNSVAKNLKTCGEIIPHGIINGVEPVEIDVEHICYDEEGHPKNKVLGDLLIYGKIDFKDQIEKDRGIDENVDLMLDLKINKKGTVSGVKITTFTLVTQDIICGPTPMLNPPLIIPTNKLKVDEGNSIKLSLSYTMGGGLNSIEASIKRIS
jgi:predicted RNA methylase